MFPINNTIKCKLVVAQSLDGKTQLDCKNIVGGNTNADHVGYDRLQVHFHEHINHFVIVNKYHTDTVFVIERLFDHTSITRLLNILFNFSFKMQDFKSFAKAISDLAKLLVLSISLNKNDDIVYDFEHR